MPAEPAGRAATGEGRRVLVLAPIGRDAESAVDMLRAAEIDAVAVSGLAALAEAIDDQAGAALVTSEALNDRDLRPLIDALESQPVWSELPFVCLAAPRSRTPARNDADLTRLTARIANVLVLERPLGRASLLSAVESALRTRARQFALRDQIGELRESRAALHRSETRFRGIANSIDHMVWSTLPDGYHDYYNDRWYEFTGVPHGSTDGEAWSGMFHPDDRDRARAVWRRCLATGEPYYIEYRLRHHSGVYRWVLGRAQPVRDDAGRIVRWFGSCTDIHELVAARELLALSRDELEREVQLRTQERDRIWQVSGDLLGVADAQGVWLAVNPAWTRVLGWRADEIVGRDTEWLTHPDDLARTRREIGGLADGRTTERFQNRLRRRDGSHCTLSWTAVPRDGLLYCVARDVTAEHEQAAALRQTEDQLRQAQKMEAVGQLTGGIAHDFNNMLQGITGALALLRKSLELGRTEGLVGFVDTASRSAHRAASLVHRLLAFSRQQPLLPRRVEVNPLIGSMADLLRRTLGENIALEFALDPELPEALCDANQLESAVLNLTINARDAMPRGGRLRIASRVGAGHDWREAPDPDARYVLVEVADNGIGMPADVAERAFEPFFTTKPMGQGTGLGLPMIYGFARQSDGFCHLQTAPGHGVTFTLGLPLALDAALHEDAPTPPVTTHWRAVSTALVVEDDAEVRPILVEALRERGLRVMQAANGTAAIGLLRGGLRVDLVVTDIGLPGMNGRQVAEAARSLDGRVRVLFMTGYDHEVASTSSYLQPGMALVAKPFDMDTFTAKVAQLLDTDPVAPSSA